MEQSKQKLLVVGMGWLGKQVASAFVGKGWEVIGLVRRFPEEVIEGVTYLVNADFGCPLEEKLDADLIFVSLSPKGDYLFYPKLLTNVISMISPGRHVIHCSSTGVYPMVNFEFHEDDLTDSGEKAVNLVNAEENVLKYSGKATVLRLGGLFGPGRIPGNFKEGTVLSGPNSLVNWIHSEVVVDAVEKVYINQKTHKEIYNLCFDNYPTKREFYGKNAARIGKELIFRDEHISLKRIVLNEKIKFLGVNFKSTMFD